MSNTQRVNVCQTPHDLIHVEIHKKHWHGLLHLGIMTRSTIYSLWYVFQHQVKIHFIFLMVSKLSHTFSPLV